MKKKYFFIFTLLYNFSLWASTDLNNELHCEIEYHHGQVDSIVLYAYEARDMGMREVLFQKESIKAMWATINYKKILYIQGHFSISFEDGKSPFKTVNMSRQVTDEFYQGIVKRNGTNKKLGIARCRL